MDILKKRLQQHMETLCLTCGSRHCGSPGEKLAADYIEDQFRQMGYTTVREEFPTVGWECTGFSLFNVTQNREVPCGTASYFSASVDVTDTLLWITSDDLLRLDTLPIRGRLCFIEACKEVNTNALSEELEELGAAAAIFVSNWHTALAPSTKAPRSSYITKMGVAAVSQEGAFDIAKHKQDVYHLKIDARKFDHMSCNVIARRDGTGKKGVFGAHYDTAPYVQGAADNASGTAVVIELARLAKDLYPDYAFDFCAFSAEEYLAERDAGMLPKCPLGSQAYMRQHNGEDIRWYMNADDFGSIIGDSELLIFGKEALPPITFECRLTREVGPLGDCSAFNRCGIPSIWVKDAPPFGHIHTVLDTIDLVSIERLEKGVKDILNILAQIAK